MNPEILAHLSVITREERQILEGKGIDRELYMQGRSNTVNAKKLLADGKLITIRPHTRFVHFPEHTHDYVEIIYMCAGSTTHAVNGREIRLEQGELLFLNQRAVHSVHRAEETDIAVNFIVLPEFFTAPLTMIGEEPTPLRSFLVDCLCGADSAAGFLHFDVSQVGPIQNLVENLLWILIRETSGKRKISEMTMALLLMQLLAHADTLTTDNQEDSIVWEVLRYVEAHYADGSLAQLADRLHYDIPWLSRKIRQKTGRTYTQLVQEKRLTQAAFLLKNTARKVSDISAAVGYENVSYFHRLFFQTFHASPKEYRDASAMQQRTLFR